MTEREVFEAALDLPQQERAAFLDRACGGAALRRRLEALLGQHDQAGSFLEDAAATGAFAAEAAGQTLDGRYKLLEEIGEGGMGTVWMAQQVEPVKRLVAVKLIKAGMDSKAVLARFEAERQALALMDHPNIAKVLDAGVADGGRPYFVMELVKGVPITRYCDEHRLTPRERLGLFVGVCKAVQHAHQKGVIHRDLKPSNVLVGLYDGKPVPKVIDFGVAKAAGQPLTDKTLVTGFGAVVGTLEYMSPEQAQLDNLDIDTRSDVYSLGVLLYVLLTGSPPFSRQEAEKSGLLEMLRVIREQEPTRPSTKLSTAEGLPTLAANRGTEPAKLTRLVRGELDWIVMKALEKDRSRRYETANGFALDVQRYLSDEPVLACPPSALYRLGKVVRRNRGALLAGALIFLLLLGGFAGTTAGLVRAGRAAHAAAEERDEKEKQREKALANLRTARRAINQMLIRLSRETLAHTPRMEQMYRDVLRDALGFYEELLAGQHDDPTLLQELALVRGWLGVAYARLGQDREAETALRQATGALEPLCAEGKLDREARDQLVRFYQQLGWLLGRGSRAAEARQARTRALEHAEKLHEDYPQPPEFRSILASCCIDLGNSHRDREPREAERLYRKALARLAEKGGNASYRGQAQLALAEMCLIHKRWQEGAGYARQAETTYLALTRRVPRFWQNWERLADVYTVRGRLLVAMGQPDEAAAAYRQAVDVLRKLQRDYPSAHYFRVVLARIDGDLQAMLAKGPSRPEEFRRLRQDIEEMLRAGEEGDKPSK